MQTFNNSQSQALASALPNLLAAVLDTAFARELSLAPILDGVPEPYHSALATKLHRATGEKSDCVEISFMEPQGPAPPISSHSRSAVVEFPFGGPIDIQLLYFHALSAPRHEIESHNRRLAALLKRRSTLCLTTPATRCTFSLTAVQVTCDSNFFGPATLGLQLPGGETFIECPVGFGDGDIEVEFSGSLGRERWRVSLERGVVRKLTQSQGKAKYPSVAHALHGARTVEIGFGTNPNAEALDVGCLFEKTLGTMHVGFELAHGECDERHVDLPLIDTKCAELEI